jgi:hypothetical protein
MRHTFREALSIVSKDKDLSDRDRAHLSRWARSDYCDNPIWERLAAAARARGMLPRNTEYVNLIGEALLARRHAESVASGIDFELRERQKQRGRHLQLAKAADELATYYEEAEAYSGIAMYFMRFLMPLSELREIHRKEAMLLRQRVGREPKPAARVSRQDRSKPRDEAKRRKGLRKIRAFVDLANSLLTFWYFDKPDHEALALLTEIAFPDADVGREDVRQALRPTTRAQRANAARALKPKKS